MKVNFTRERAGKVRPSFYRRDSRIKDNSYGGGNIVNGSCIASSGAALSCSHSTLVPLGVEILEPPTPVVIRLPSGLDVDLGRRGLWSILYLVL